MDYPSAKHAYSYGRANRVSYSLIPGDYVKIYSVLVPYSCMQIFFDKSFKGTVSIISSILPCTDGNARFTRVPLQALSAKI